MSSLERIVSRIKDPGIALYVQDERNVFGQFLVAIVAELDAIHAAPPDVEVPAPVGFAAADEGDPATSESDSGPLITADEAKTLVELIAQHYRHPSFGTGRLVEDVALTIVALTERVQRAEGFVRALVPRLVNATALEVGEQDHVDDVTLRQSLGALLSAREQVAMGAAKLLGPHRDASGDDKPAG